MTDGRPLGSHHQATLEKTLAHAVSHNIQWHDVLSPLESVGTDPAARAT